MKSILINLGLIGIGSVVFVIGMNGILIPHEFLTGGLTGFAILLHYLVPFMNIGLLIFLLNIPLMILGWYTIHREFMLYTIFGILFFSAAADMIHIQFPPINDPILAAVFSGVICGAGSGIILHSAGSGGGVDILSIFLNRKFGFRVGTLLFAANASVLIAGAYLYDIQILLYSIIFLFCSGRVTDAVLTGFNKRKSILVISDEAESISNEILSQKGRGVTYLNGEGAFTGKPKKVIFTIITLSELPKIKQLILKIDPAAFIVVNDTLEVLGKRHGSGRVF